MEENIIKESDYDELKIQELLKQSKQIQKESPFSQNKYFDFNYKGEWCPAKIESKGPNTTYDIIFASKNEMLLMTIPQNSKVSFFREHVYTSYVIPSKPIVNDYEKSIKKLNDVINNNFDSYKPNDIVQFLNGFLFELVSFTLTRQNDSKAFELITKIFEMIKKITKFSLNNSFLFKILTTKGRSIFLADKDLAVAASYGGIIDLLMIMVSKNKDVSRFYKEVLSKNNSLLMLQYDKKEMTKNFYENDNYRNDKAVCYYIVDFMIKCKIVSNILGLLEEGKIENISLVLIDKIIGFKYELESLGCEIVDNEKGRKFYNNYLKKIESLTESELREIKRFSTISEYATRFFRYILGMKSNQKALQEIQYSFIYRCLISSNLEKKIFGMNNINLIIEKLDKNKDDIVQFDSFLKNKKIIQIILGESTHDEILKRSVELFRFLAEYTRTTNCKNAPYSIELSEETYKLLWDNYQKHESISSQIENIICKIVLELPNQNRLNLFTKLKELSKEMVKTSPKKYFNFLLRFTQGCLQDYPIDLEENEDFQKAEKKLYGLPLMYNYVIDGKLSKEITEQCMDSIVIILRGENISENIIETILNLLLNNIKAKHSTIYSMNLFKKILVGCCNEDEKRSESYLLKRLDDNYDIIQLIVDDIIAYITRGAKDTEEINSRLDFLFFFFTDEVGAYQLNIKGKEQLFLIYDTFSKSIQENIGVLNEYILKNLDNLNSEALDVFFSDVISNKKYYDPKTLTDIQLNTLIEVFKIINIENKPEPLLTRDKNLRVRGPDIKGIDVLYTMLIESREPKIKSKLCKILTDLCLNMLDYKSSFVSVYWKNFINTLTNYLQDNYKENNSTGIHGLVQLITMIYNRNSENGEIPKKDVVSTKSSKTVWKFIHFHYIHSKKPYRLRVRENYTILLMRWRIGYFFDIPVNNIVFKDAEKKKSFSLLNDSEKFLRVFPFENEIFVYLLDKNPLLSLPNNPKLLIDENEKIREILLKLLQNDNEDYISTVWEIINKIPKKILSNSIISNLETEKQKDEIIKRLFNTESLHVLTFTFDSIIYHFETELIDKKGAQEKFIKNLIVDRKIDKTMIEIYLSLSLKSGNSKISFKCLLSLIKLLCKVFKESMPPEETIKKIISKSKDFIKSVMELSDSIKLEFKDAHEVSAILERSFLSEVEENFNSKNVQYSPSKYDKYSSFINECCVYGEAIKGIFEVIKELNGEFIDIFMKKSTNDIEKIFISGYILTPNSEIKKVLFQCLLDAINANNIITVNFFDILFSSSDLLKYINKNDRNGTYYHLLSVIIKTLNLNESMTEKIKKSIKELVEFIKSSEEDKIIEGVLTFLCSILSLSQKFIDYISDFDINKIIIDDCLLSKCNKNPLTQPKPKCSSRESQIKAYSLLTILAKKDTNLKKIIDKLSGFHQMGFWKTNDIVNWRLNYSNDSKSKYVGLKNLGYTCYMNSILQQFSMIPAIGKGLSQIKEESDKKNTLLYQLKKVLAALYYYESQYYNPKDLCENFDGEKLDIREQMDADEFFSKIIDKIDHYTKESIFKNIFGGISVDELSFINCGHKRENQFYFNSIQLQVANKHNLSESLSTYTAEERMDGDNMIICEECKKKVPAIKRQVIKQLPERLLLVLKRFEFDYDSMLKYKLNDYFEFPFEIDMAPYTQKNVSDPSTQYYLTGVVIHSGTSESGHYYSLIKSEEQDWYEFNDTDVKEIEAENYMKNYAFGEAEEKMSTRDSQNESQEKVTNAYILIYSKVDVKNSKEKFDLPAEILKEINNEMYYYWIMKNISSFEYQSFIIDIFKYEINNIKNNENVLFRNDNFELSCEEDYTDVLPKREFSDISSNIPSISEKNDSVERKGVTNIFVFCAVYYFNILLRCKEKENLPEFTDEMKMMINSDVERAVWIIEEFSDEEVLDEFLVRCPVSLMQKVTVGIIYCACIKVAGVNLAPIMNLLNVLLKIVKKEMKNINLGIIYHLIYRILQVKQNQQFITYLKEKVKFDTFILEYFGSFQQPPESLNSENPKKPSHNELKKKIDAQRLKLTLSEETGEAKKKDRLSKIREDRYLLNILIILLSPEELLRVFQDTKNPFFRYGRAAQTAFLLVKKISALDDYLRKLDKFLNSIYQFLINEGPEFIDFPLMLLRLILFYLPVDDARIESALGRILKIIEEKKLSYDYMIKIKNFSLLICNCHWKKLAPFNEYIIDIIGVLFKFFNQNRKPPKNTKKENGVYTSKRTYEYMISLSSKEYEIFKEEENKKANETIDNLRQINNNGGRDEKSYDLCDLSDFKFIPGDKINYYDSIYKVKVVLDEIILISPDESHYKCEWVETDNCNIKFEKVI